MAHYQKSLAAAVVLNTAISAVEAVAGFESGSLSLLMDSAHNLNPSLRECLPAIKHRNSVILMHRESPTDRITKVK